MTEIPEILEAPSPNHDARGVDITMLVLHYTGMQSGAAALDRLCDPGAKVSAHYLIDEDGTIHRLVAEDRRAWHAGVAHWHGRNDVNAASIGIELVNPGHEYGYRPFPDAQMHALVDLAGRIVRRYAILPRHVVGHSDVAPTRKQDPGELFDWGRLARAGIGLWPQPNFRAAMAGPELGPDSPAEEIGDLQRALRTLGYGLADDGVYGPVTTAVVTAFQRHWWQGGMTGRACPATQSLLGHLVGLAFLAP